MTDSLWQQTDLTFHLRLFILVLLFLILAFPIAHLLDELDDDLHKVALPSAELEQHVECSLNEGLREEGGCNHVAHQAEHLASADFVAVVSGHCDVQERAEDGLPCECGRRERRRRILFVLCLEQLQQAAPRRLRSKGKRSDEGHRLFKARRARRTLSAAVLDELARNEGSAGRERGPKVVREGDGVEQRWARFKHGLKR